MQFTKSVSLFALFFLGLVGLVAASPVTPAKRDVDAQVSAVVTTLQSAISAPLASIATTGQNPNATTDDFTASMADLSAALQTATASLSAIQPDSVTSKRQTESDVATLVADIVTEIATTLNGIADTSLISSLLPGLDADLDAVLTGLETLLAGVLNLVATLLVDVAGLLQNLAPGLTLGSLGL